MLLAAAAVGRLLLHHDTHAGGGRPASPLFASAFVAGILAVVGILAWGAVASLQTGSPPMGNVVFLAMNDALILGLAAYLERGSVGYVKERLTGAAAG